MAQLPLYRPTRRSAASWFGSACIFWLKLLASVLAGVVVATVLWQDNWKPVPSPEGVRKKSVAHSGSGETTVYRSPTAQGGVDRGWDRPPSNYPLRVKTMTFTPPAQEATGAIPSQRGAGRGVAPEAPSASLIRVKSWHYQLQNINPSTIARSPEDLVVVDYDGGDGDPSTPLSKSQIDQMRRKPDGSRRLVLAYLSIGEAESYRSYWNSTWRKRPPAWLGKENARWRGNYEVRFWEPAWQDIVFNYADRILSAGFDGIYMDKVDQFIALGNKEAMIQFVVAIAARVKAKRPDFLVVSQNGEDLIPDIRFRDAIDAFAREDLFYGEDGDGTRNVAEDVSRYLSRLNLLAAERKPVFVVEYLHNEKLARIARDEIGSHGFIGLVTRRKLDGP